jgi:hypothetical protein
MLSNNILRLLRRVCIGALVAVAAAPCTVSHAREKSDLVYLDFGGFVKGEIRSMSLAQLSLDSDEVGVISVKWSHITGIESEYNYEIGMEDGAEYFGALSRTADPGWLVVAYETSMDTLDIQNVVYIAPIEKKHWLRLHGYLNAGFTFTKSSEVIQLTVNWLVTYRTRDDAVKLSADVIFNRTDGVTTTQRQDYFIGYERFLVEKWFAAVAIAPQQNLLMGVQLRTLLAIGAGVNLIETNHDVLSVTGGIDWNKEVSTGSEPDRRSWEALGSVSYSYFQRDFPVTNVAANLAVFPSLTISGRVRVEFDATVGRELIDDFNTSVRVYGSRDDDPPEQGAAERDYGIVLSLGWTY